jgi:photosynthetic reaction center cytochrome c subunit
VAVGVVVAVITTATFYWIYELASGPERREAAAAALLPYQSSQGVTAISSAQPNQPTDGREPWLGADAWAKGVQAGQEYIIKFPNTINVQVLQGLTSAQVWGYMVQNVSGALGVGCQYCHDINNFAKDTYPQKVAARNMMRLVADANTQFIVNLPNWKGNHIQCATCHQAQAVNMPAYDDQFIKSNPPIKVTVDPLDAEGKPVTEAAQKPAEIQQPVLWRDAVLYYIYNYPAPWKPFDPADPYSGRGALALVYEGARTQEQVNINQSVMNTMAWSLGVNCNFCHNSRNFLAYENGAASSYVDPQAGYNKLKAQRMLQMTTWMVQNWEKYGAIPKTDITFKGANAEIDGVFYRKINEKVYVVPGCYTCHGGRNIPWAAVNQTDLVGDASITLLPPAIRGTQK